MATWDVFHSERLELERALTSDQVRAGLARGDILDDDLIRPAGSAAAWTRIGDRHDLLADAPEIAPAPEPPPAPTEPDRATEPEPPPVSAPPPPSRRLDPLVPTIPDQPVVFRDDDEGEDDVEFLEPEPEPESDPDDFRPPSSPYVVGEHAIIPPDPAPAPAPVPIPPPRPRGRGGDEPYGEFDLDLRRGRAAEPPAASSVELVTGGADFEDDEGEEDGDEYDPLEEDEAVAEFTLARGMPERVEELDLAAMVDVAFQMVLFFLVTATTVLYKTLEVPKPNPENAPSAAAAQGRPKSLEDLKDDFILVEIDTAGAVKIDHDAVPAELAALTERLRSERERTGRKAMLLSADFSTPHRSAVLAYDAANEIGLGIAIARPSSSAMAAPPPILPRAAAGAAAAPAS